MIEVVFLISLALVWILFATIQDLKNREVFDWINFSLIIFVLGFRFFYSLFNEGNFSFFYSGLIGLAIFFILGNIFYYSRVFAGGDAKLMISLGCILPFTNDFFSNLKIFVIFILTFFLCGAMYGGISTIYLSFKNFKAFKKGFTHKLIENKKFLLYFLGLGVLFLFLGVLEGLFFSFGILILFFPLFYFYAKTVDSVCLSKSIKTKDLTGGEWLYNQLKVGRKFIKPTWEGLTLKDIRLIKKHYKKINIKQGIPFVPVFLVSFLVLTYLWVSGFLFTII